MNSSRDEDKEEQPDNEHSAADKPVDLTQDLDDLDAEAKEFRRRALVDMLQANQARRQSILRNQRPTLVVGESVLIIIGALSGSKGVVLDADFISSRVQLDVEGENDPIWLPFEAVGQFEGPAR